MSNYEVLSEKLIKEMLDNSQKIIGVTGTDAANT